MEATNATSRIRASLGPPWPTASLSTYLVAVILLATVPIAALMAYQIYSSLRGQQVQLQGELRRGAASLAYAVEREVASSIDALSILAESESLQAGAVERFRRSLSSGATMRANWGGAYLRDADGTLLFDTSGLGPFEPARRLNLGDFGRVDARRQARVSNVIQHPSQPGLFITAIEVPVVVNQSLRYVLGAWIDVNVWQLFGENTGLPRHGFATVVDREQRIIARTVEPVSGIGERMPEATATKIRSGPSGVLRGPTLEGGSAFAAWHTLPLTGWSVIFGVATEPVERAQTRAMVAALTTAGGCLLLGVTLALLVAQRVARPLRDLTTHGAARTLDNIPVREISLLRDALLAAHAQDQVARDRLQRKADEFETLFNGSPIGLAFAQDPQCRVVLHNAAMDQLFGSSSLHGSGTVRVLYRGRALERDMQPLQRAAMHGDTVNAMELEILTEGQPPTYVLAHAVPLRDPDGRPRGAIGAVVDITERKLAEARLLSADRRLRESQHLVDLAQEAGHVGFFQYRFIEDSLAWTPGQAKLFGFDSAPAEGSLEDWIRRIDPEDRIHVEQAVRRMLDRRQAKETLEFRVSHADGSVRWLSSRVLVTYADPGGAPQQMIGVTMDMTEHKRAERERAELTELEQKARLEAEASNRAKDEFLAMLGHELRNPLSAIGSAVEVLNRVDGSAEVAVAARNIIARQTRHLAHLMDDLLDVTRVIRGKIMLTRQKVNLASLVQRAIATLEVTGSSDRHHMELDLREVWIDADATRIEQIVSNLLTNAFKYTPDGGRIDVTTRFEDGQAVLEVRDTGSGIPPSLLPRIFDLFVQGERTLDRRAGGLGIGLTLVRRLVELHGGRITAESPGSGSVFRVALPAVEPPPAIDARPYVPESRRQRVAVIEDNEDALNALRTILELDGHTVTTATDGISGLAWLLERRPDAAVVDIGLPGITGYEVAKRARAGGYSGRMIAVSGYGQGRDIEQAMKSGFDAHLVKPVDASQLSRILAEP
jgi:PAS domain S-box-containing protein